VSIDLDTARATLQRYADGQAAALDPQGILNPGVVL
jgi:hypothetical protein